MHALRYLIGAAVGLTVVVPLFERFAPYRLIKGYWKIVNPVFGLLAGRVPGLVLLETVGRRTGEPRRIPVGGRLEDGTLWVVLAHGRNNSSLKNIRVNPKVRVRVSRRWRDGIAAPLAEDAARRRALWVNPLNGVFQMLASSDQVSVRIDLT